MIPSTFPETPAELYDLIHELFGIGDYDRIGNPNPPWFRARMKEIFKLRSQLKARHATTKQVAIAAWYAHTTGARIRWTSDLFKLIPEAMKAYRQAEAERDRAAARAEREAVLQEAIDAGDMRFAERLHMASENEARLLVEKWRRRHG